MSTSTAPGGRAHIAWGSTGAASPSPRATAASGEAEASGGTARGRCARRGGMGLGVAVAVFLAAWTGPVAGQAGHVHTPGMQGATEAPPSEVGHAAFATLQEVVRILERDPGTDWRRVDLEALRQHLVDMNEVTLRARVEARDTVGGAVFVVDGPPRTRSALHRMVPAHAAATVDDPRYRMQVVPAAGGGVRVTATVKEPGDTEGVVRIRALGFVGMLVRGMHHGPHHLAIARGADPHGGHGAHHPGN